MTRAERRVTGKTHRAVLARCGRLLWDRVALMFEIIKPTLDTKKGNRSSPFPVEHERDVFAAPLHALAQRVGGAGRAELRQGNHLQLADALARDAQLLADLQQRATASIADAIAQNYDRAFAGR